MNSSCGCDGMGSVPARSHRPGRADPRSPASNRWIPRDCAAIGPSSSCGPWQKEISASQVDSRVRSHRLARRCPGANPKPPTRPPPGTYVYSGRQSPSGFAVVGPRIGYAGDTWLPYLEQGIDLHNRVQRFPPHMRRICRRVIGQHSPGPQREHIPRRHQLLVRLLGAVTVSVAYLPAGALPTGS